MLNRELGADFDPDAFEHVALWDPQHEWIEMRLRVDRRQRCGCADLGLTVEFADGEEMRTEISAKFRRAGVRAELAAAGLAMRDWWTDAAGQFGLSLSAPVYHDRMFSWRLLRALYSPDSYALVLLLIVTTYALSAGLTASWASSLIAGGPDRDRLGDVPSRPRPGDRCRRWPMSRWAWPRSRRSSAWSSTTSSTPRTWCLGELRAVPGRPVAIVRHLLSGRPSTPRR